MPNWIVAPMRTDLARFFSPRSIAIIGASQDLVSISGQPLKHLVAHQYAGKLFPVNPKYQEVLGVKCYPSLAALPETPELALVVVNASRVADTLRACGKLGVPYAIVFSSGFSETGGKGVAMQRELAEIAAEFNIGIVGPNCQGMINPAARVYAGFGSIFGADYEPGGVSMVSQSGGFGFSVMNLAAEGGLHFRQAVTTGNEIGVSSLDFIDYFIDDEHTDIIVCYIEGLKDAHRLIGVGNRALANKKPIFAWKVGNTEQGQKAAASHTANLGGEMALYKAAFHQAGIIQVDDIQDVIDYSLAFQCGKLPAGNRVAIITISGGAGILMTDECVNRGMQVPPLSAATTDKLRDIVPSFGSLVNPIDVTAAIFSDLSMIGRTLNAVLDDPNVDSIAMINASLMGESGRERGARNRGGRKTQQEADISRLERAGFRRAGSVRYARCGKNPALQVARALRPRAVGAVVVRRSAAPRRSVARRHRACNHQRPRARTAGRQDGRRHRVRGQEGARAIWNRRYA